MQVFIKKIMDFSDRDKFKVRGEILNMKLRGNLFKQSVVEI